MDARAARSRLTRSNNEKSATKKEIVREGKMARAREPHIFYSILFQIWITKKETINYHIYYINHQILPPLAPSQTYEVFAFRPFKILITFR